MITSENYFSSENQMACMGASQFKAFQKCEAAALAEIKGEYVRPSSTSMLVGSYVDAHFEGTLHIFKAQHPELFKRDGGLKSDYLHANDIISRMESDRLYSLLMSGKKQVIKTGTIAGVPFKIKIDSLLDADTCKQIASEFPDAAAALGFCDGAIVDQKVMKDMEPVWSSEDHCKLPFVESWGYDIQGAIYRAVEGNMLPFVLAVGTKEDEPDLAALYIQDSDLAAKLAEIEDAAPRYQAIKEGKVSPRRCEHCAYCRMTKRLSGIINYKELGADAE
ncbi:PD-(D/E)XK nuclease-like domain-containing protein [Oscillibacter ruminantium]|uniref:PD-(D/E)XK nuclease-like domain-containing protein n=1 Tax=Oscillibacter ruminantium TaxID=1263547 RepID=UPI0025AA8AE9|nr:PD-(D/E)XK nuclease-like domain-containing protein [Oscillibacter valericigenes]